MQCAVQYAVQFSAHLLHGLERVHDELVHAREQPVAALQPCTHRHRHADRQSLRGSESAGVRAGQGTVGLLDV